MKTIPLLLSMLSIISCVSISAQVDEKFDHPGKIEITHFYLSTESSQLSKLGSRQSDSECLAQELVIEGPEDICPGEVTFADVEEANSFPAEGGQGIRFTNYDDMDFVISGMEFPYSFDDDINGILSANNVNPLRGPFSLTTVTFSDSNNVTTSICSEYPWPVDMFFFDSASPDCDDDPCFAQDLILIGSSDVCPTAISTVDVENPNTIPPNGGEGLRITDGDDFNLVLPDVEFPFEFDSDLNGYLNDNDLEPLEGTFFFGAVVYDDSSNPENSICWSGSLAELNFLSPINPDCIEENCFAQELTSSGTQSICPTQFAFVNVENVNTVPEGGGEGIRFSNGSDVNFIVPEVQFPYQFDGGINSFLTSNGLDPIEGLIDLTTIVYEDVNDIPNSICAESSNPISVEFIPGSNPECLTCTAQDVWPSGPNTICPGETTSINLETSASIPTAGGQGLRCTNGDDINIILPNISFPFTLDNDLNGFLSSNGMEPLVGQFQFINVIYTDQDDFENTICSESEWPYQINFLSPNHVSCVPCEIQNLELTGDQYICPDDTTVLDFGGDNTIPDGGAIGLHVTSVGSGTDLILTNVDFPLSVDFDLGGYISSNDLDPFYGWVLFTPFIYLDVNDIPNSICHEGDQTDIFFLEASSNSCLPECIAQDLVLEGSNEICPGENTIVDLFALPTIPDEGGLGIRFSNGDDVNIIYSGMGFPYTFDNDLNGELSAAGFDPFEGTFMLTAFVYDDPNNANSICAESDNPVMVTFLTEDHPECVLSVFESTAGEAWEIFPNPSNDLLFVQYDPVKPGNSLVEIVDLQGRVIKLKRFSASSGKLTIDIDVNDLSSGYYRVILNADGRRLSKALMITD